MGGLEPPCREWLFENVDVMDGMDEKQTKVDLELADWCLARLPTTNPAAVLLVANDKQQQASSTLEFYQLVLHMKAKTPHATDLCMYCGQSGHSH